MNLRTIHLKNFRCFKQTTLELDNSLVLIEGNNGIGKTSLLEALYYACYLRSFRTHLPKELVQFGHDGFFVRINLESHLENHLILHEIQVGFADGKRLVKVDKKTVSSYKQLMDHYRVVSLTEDDLMIIKGSPQVRRSFIDQAILLNNPSFVDHIRSLKLVVDNRNSLLRQGGKFDRAHYNTWTQQLWEKSVVVQQVRATTLNIFAQHVNQLVATFFKNDFSISFEYSPRKMPLGGSFEDFVRNNPDLLNQEQRLARSLFGAHLDDFIIRFQDKQSKRLASRGQQKLIVLLLKVAQMRQLANKREPGIFLLDDFMTDFDLDRSKILVDLLYNMGNQLIFTSPIKDGALHEYLRSRNAQVVPLTY